MCKWMDKVVDGIEVYQVGKQQLWDWCGWTSYGFDSAHSYNNETVLCYADSLRKGMYVLVAGPATFGKYWRPRVYDAFTSLAAAVEYAQDETAWHGYHITHYSNKVTVGYDFEIWHVVDDVELWQEWECLSAQYVFENQLGCNVPNDYVTEEAYAAMGRVAPWNDLDYAPAPLKVGHVGSDVLESLRQLREAGAIA